MVKAKLLQLRVKGETKQDVDLIRKGFGTVLAQAAQYIDRFKNLEQFMLDLEHGREVQAQESEPIRLPKKAVNPLKQSVCTSREDPYKSFNEVDVPTPSQSTYRQTPMARQSSNKPFNHREVPLYTREK